MLWEGKEKRGRRWRLEKGKKEERRKVAAQGVLLQTHRCNPSGLNGLQLSSGEDSPNVTYAERKDKKDCRGTSRIWLTQIFSYMFGMALVNLPINSVKCPIHRLIPIQHPTEMVPVTKGVFGCLGVSSLHRMGEPG